MMFTVTTRPMAAHWPQSNLPRAWTYHHSVQLNLFYSQSGSACTIDAASDRQCNHIHHNDSNIKWWQQFRQWQQRLPTQHYWYRQCFHVKPLWIHWLIHSLIHTPALPQLRVHPLPCTSAPMVTKMMTQWSPNHSVTTFKHSTIPMSHTVVALIPWSVHQTPHPSPQFTQTIPHSLSLPNWRIVYPRKLSQKCPLMHFQLTATRSPTLPQNTVPNHSMHYYCLSLFTLLCCLSPSLQYTICASPTDCSFCQPLTPAATCTTSSDPLTQHLPATTPKIPPLSCLIYPMPTTL